SVTPASGTTSTPFTFQTTYYDAGGAAPTLALVYIDNGAYALAPVSGSLGTGLVFQYTTTLSSGNHSYYFVFSDGTTRWTNPLAPIVYAGPAVGTGTPQTGRCLMTTHEDNPDLVVPDLDD